jgi:hypothetical protein
MASIHKEKEVYIIYHPLDDPNPSPKIDLDKLGPMKLTIGVKILLTVLKFYLIAMVVCVLYRILCFAGII